MQEVQLTLDNMALAEHPDVKFPFAIPKGCPVPPSWPPPPDFWDAIVVCISGGVDSQAMLWWARDTFPADRIIAVHNDVGDDHTAANRLVPFVGTREFVIAECEAAGVPLIITEGKTVLDVTEARGMWSDSQVRLCTSNLKRDPTDKILRNLYLDLVEGRGKWPNAEIRLCTDRLKSKPTDAVLRKLQAKKILICTGELAAESPPRAKKKAWDLRTAATAPTKGRLVVWHRPMHAWTKAEEILFLWSKGREIAPTYRVWSRLSCKFCFFMPWREMVASFVAYPQEAMAFVALEEQIQHKVTLNYKWPLHAEEPEYFGYRAVWEAVYGPWGNAPGDPSPYALDVVRALQTESEGILERLRQGEQVSLQHHAVACA